MKLKLLMAAALCPLLGFSQLSIGNLAETYTIDFDNAVSGVNTGAYQGAGWLPTGGSGALNTSAFSFSGLQTAPTSISIGGTASQSEASRGVSNGFTGALNGGAVTSQRGFYSFNTSNSPILAADYCLGWFSDGVSLAPGEVILKVTNTTGSTINVARLAYEIKTFNEYNASTQVNVTYSFSEFGTYVTFDSDLNFTSPGSQSGSPSWVSTGLAADKAGLSWADGTSMYIKWTFDYASGSGKMDYMGIDNISIKSYNADYVHIDNVWSPSEPVGGLTTSTALALPNNATNAAPISGSTTLKDFYIESGAKVNVTGDLTLAPGGKLYLLADGNGYAQIMGDVYSVTAVYQTHRLASSGKWFNMAIPVSAQWDDLTGIFIQTTSPANTNLYYYDATNPATNTSDGTWEHVTDKTTADVDDRGYQLYGGDGTFFGSGPFDLEVEGPLVEAPVSIAVSGQAVGRLNLVPNPFPSHIEWEEVVTDNPELGNTYYIQDGDPNLATTQYQTYTFNGSGTNGATDDIPPGQAFFVTVDNTTDGTIDFIETQRNVDNEQFLYKTTSIPGLVKFHVEHMNLKYADESEIRFDANYNDNSLFREDGSKRMNIGYPNIYTKSADNKELVFNGLNDAWTTKDVDLYFQGDEAGNYQLNMNYDGLPAEWTIILEDKMLGNFVNLRKSGYGFTHAIGANADRFVVHFNKTGAIGLEELDGSVIFSYVKNSTLAVNLDDVNNAEITVFDMNGKQVASAANQNGVVEFNMADWASGVYVINVTSNGKQVHSNKVVH